MYKKKARETRENKGGKERGREGGERERDL